MGAITIVGTGWTAGQLTLDAAQALSGGARVLLHTERCACADWLRERDIPFEPLDALYEVCEDFDAHARMAADAVRRAAADGDVVYGVLDVRDRSARLLATAGDCARVIAGPPAEGALLAYADGAAQCVEASAWEDYRLSARECCLVRELDSRELAAEVKLKLMEVYPEACDIRLIGGEGRVESVPLYALDRQAAYDHRTCALIPAQRDVTALERFDFGHLNEIMRLLCGPGGCPWDRAQTHESLRGCMLEEACEVIDAIDEGDADHLYDELGDVLMQVAIHAEIARRHGEFDISDVTTAICRKLIDRHTHVFGEDSAQDPEAVLALWSRNKMAERRQERYAEALRDVTRTLPQLLRAVKVLKRSAEAGLADGDARAVSMRCAERFGKLAEDDGAEAAMGEALMDVASLSRLMGVDPEIALNGAVNRYIDRFDAMERRIRADGVEIGDLDEKTLREYWDSVKL